MNGSKREKLRTMIFEMARDFVVIGIICALLLIFGCSQLRPTSKSQQMTTFSLGLPAVVVVSTTSFEAENSGDDEHSGMTATNEVDPTANLDLKKDEEER